MNKDDELALRNTLSVMNTCEIVRIHSTFLTRQLRIERLLEKTKKQKDLYESVKAEHNEEYKYIINRMPFVIEALDNRHITIEFS